MTVAARPFALPLAAALALAGVLIRGQEPQDRQQTFRTRTDVVFVDVSLRERGQAVTGLRAEDFVLTDNGVRQRIESVEATAVPIDLTLAIDVSGNPRHPWTPYVSPAKVGSEIRKEVGEVVRLLRPADRLRLLAIDTRVQQIWPMQSVASLPPTLRVQPGGMSALYDAVAAALIQPVEPARRHVVIVSTKGVDTISSVDAQTLRAVAERSDALLHVVATEADLDNDAALNVFQCQFMGFCWPTSRFWVPLQRRLFGGRPVHRLMPDGQAVAAGAEATGGGLHQGALLHVPTLTSTFRKTFEDFRSSYVLRYTPEGVPQTGWHSIEVTVPRSRSHTVRARPGYLVEAPAVPLPAKPIPEVPRSLAELVNVYDARAYRQVAAGLRQAEEPLRLLKDFEVGGNPWPATPRIEAAFALELAEPAIFSTRPEIRQSGHDLLTRFTRLIRNPLEPDVFERYWYFAALTMLEGSLRPAITEAFADRALARFPDEPRFLLSRAIAVDQRWVTRSHSDATDDSGTPLPAHAAIVRSTYGAAVSRPETAVEARMRLAWFLHRMNLHEEALAQLTEAGAQPINETALRYLRQLFLGHVLNALDRQEEAVNAFRDALTLRPAAQSARVALMNTLIVRGHRAEADALAEKIQTDTADPFDPWWMYWQGQYRLHPQALARIRELSR